MGVFEWSTLDRILRRADGLDGLVVRGGRELEVPLPRDLEALRSLFERGLGLVIRRAERQDDGLAALAGAFATDLPGVVHLQLFVTAAGTNGFGWHYDTEEGFIVQTAGVKTYYFRENTVVPDPRPGPRQDFTRVREETSPPMACTRRRRLALPAPRLVARREGRGGLLVRLDRRPARVTDLEL